MFLTKGNIGISGISFLYDMNISDKQNKHISSVQPHELINVTKMD